MLVAKAEIGAFMRLGFGKIVRFYLGPETGNDYLSDFRNCLFHRNEVMSFRPRERYLTGSQLIKLWERYYNDQTRIRIQEFIKEHKLNDMHPSQACTVVSMPEYPDHPPLEEGLFAFSEVKHIQEQSIRTKFFRAKPKKSSTEKETPSARRARLIQWIEEEEQRLGKKHGALKAVADREKISPQAVKQILKREK